VARDAPTSPRAWCVLHTRPRTEKLVAERLVGAGIEHYLPLVVVRHTYAKSRIAFEKPLFPGYVFLRGGEDERLAALRTNKVVSTIRVGDQMQLERELAQIRTAIAAGAALDVFPALGVGARCRVVSGPLAGLEGVITGEASRSRLFLSVTALGQSAVLDIDAAMLERID
jgi:transcription antitermination factor NusG